MNLKFLILSIITVLTNYNCREPHVNQLESKTDTIPYDTAYKKNENYKPNTLVARIPTPANYKRLEIKPSSFAHYLRTIPLKSLGSKVEYFNGQTKPSVGVYTAVLDLEIGKHDLHQCADAIMRLKAEYHWGRKEYDKIHFKLTNGFEVEYIKWMEGKRIIVDGNKTIWDNGTRKASNTYADFWDYMELIFMYAGTASLSKELKSVDIDKMEIGDVLIIGGHPGHAVIVMDMAINSITNKKIFLLAQSYMPAQHGQILINPSNNSLSPWYSLSNDAYIHTPEWTFSKTDLKRFE